jgi:hypothetical protein
MKIRCPTVLKEISLNRYLDEKFKLLPNWIEIRTSPIEPENIDKCNQPLESERGKLPDGVTCLSLAPVMRTHSALAVLKSGAGVEYVSPDEYRTIRKQEWNTYASWGSTPEFYTLLPEEEDSVDCDQPRTKIMDKTTGEVLQDQAGYPVYESGGCEQPSYDAIFKRMNNFITCYISHADNYPLYTITPDDDVHKYCDVDDYHTDPDHPTIENWFGNPDSQTVYRTEGRLAEARRYILIIESTEPPEQALPEENAFVSFQYKGKWYFISDKDDVSKEHFALVSELLSIMAIPTQTAQPTPSVSVNGR